MTSPDPKYVTGDRPVNRRTAARQVLQPQPVNPLVQERLLATQARQRLGPPLAELVRAAQPGARPARLGPLAVVGSIVSAASAVALFLAWLQVSVLLAGIGAAGLALGIMLARRGIHAAQPPAATPASPLFDSASLHALDQALEEMAPEMPESAIARLTDLKQLIVRIARHVDSTAVDENFTMEDRLYVNECVRRYLPDSLQAYLLVPREKRALQVLDEGRTALTLLEGQLDLLRAELEQREAKLARSAGEELLRQQRFLKSKSAR